MTIEKLKAAYEAATPGEWVTNNKGAVCTGRSWKGIFSDEDATFIALAHRMVPKLLEAVEALEAIRARFDGVFDHPALVKYGPLDTSAARDMYRLADNALENLK